MVKVPVYELVPYGSVAIGNTATRRSSVSGCPKGKITEFDYMFPQLVPILLA